VNVPVAILTLVLVALVVAVVSAPLRRRAHDSLGSSVPTAPGSGRAVDDAAAVPQANVRNDLDAAREAKYREIRDAELDYRTGKLSREDFEAIDAELRCQAIEILNRIDATTPDATTPDEASDGASVRPRGA
jgi:hypothetical protein